MSGLLPVIIAVLLIGVLIGGKGMRAVGRVAGSMWRPGVGVLSLVSFLASAGFGVRQSWVLSAGLFVAGLVMAMGVRKAPHPGQSGPRPQPPARTGGMTLTDARAILGVSPGATEEEIQAAYLRLIRRAHPDQGGTTGLAAQLNAARDTLLRKD